MDRRYQVFVSSTYADLFDERREVIQALLELDCIPAGMELFPAADDDQWELIKSVIDDCDYYAVIVAGRYGSVDAAGISFTEKEYRYALDTHKPIIGFVHSDITKIESGKVDLDPEQRRRLNEFVDLVKKKPVRFWNTASELGSQVSRSVVKLIKSHPSAGWVRADNLPDESAAQEILKLRQEVDRLEHALEEASVAQPKSAAGLSQGADQVRLYFNVVLDDYFDVERQPWNANLAWNEIVYAISPILIDAATSEAISRKLGEYIAASRHEGFIKNERIAQVSRYSIALEPASLDTIIVQLNALGIIRKSIRARSVKDTSTYWELTTYGEKLMYEVRAIRPSPQFEAIEEAATPGGEGKADGLSAAEEPLHLDR